MITGAVFTMATVISIAVASLSDDDKAGKNTKSLGNNIIAEDANGDAKQADDNESGIFPVTTQTIVFQIVMVFASFYYGMLFSNWGVVSIRTQVSGEADVPKVGYERLLADGDVTDEIVEAVVGAVAEEVIDAATGDDEEVDDETED